MRKKRETDSYPLTRRSPPAPPLDINPGDQPFLGPVFPNPTIITNHHNYPHYLGSHTLPLEFPTPGPRHPGAVPEQDDRHVLVPEPDPVDLRPHPPDAGHQLRPLCHMHYISGVKLDPYDPGPPQPKAGPQLYAARRHPHITLGPELGPPLSANQQSYTDPDEGLTLASKRKRVDEMSFLALVGDERGGGIRRSERLRSRV